MGQTKSIIGACANVLGIISGPSFTRESDNCAKGHKSMLLHRAQPIKTCTAGHSVAKLLARPHRVKKSLIRNNLAPGRRAPLICASVVRGPGKPCVNMAQGGGQLRANFSFSSVHPGPHIFILVWRMSGGTNCAPAY